MSSPRPREDILVSVCLTEAPADVDALGRLEALMIGLGQRFRYFEVLVAIDAEQGDAAMLRGLGANLRILTLRTGISFYRRRAAVAMEAIGDIVVLTTPTELALFDILHMIDDAIASSSIIVGRRGQARMLDPALSALGRGAGFRVSTRDMRTAAYPRTLLNRLLAHPDHRLALRFAPIDASIPVREHPPESLIPRPREGRLHRLKLLHRLLISSAPAVLTVVALGGLLAAGVACIFTIYVIIVWATFDKVEPGWLTTSLALSMTALFLGIAFLGLSIGLQKLLEAVSIATDDDVVGEASSIDLFGKVIEELNVEVEFSRNMNLAGPGPAHP
ncbi:hypothetical protein [Sphingomonas sp. S-NIH.Pt15_0812]|uniref:hypothetical protein n=1 Tax=Sphingomonas sp. S-NIH.Pt15_0812 TaxID=1920129 RepID=UPI000F7D6BF3|nr:hypothetical protein [Sphingomonas sp. S-NIH.Pt15_0812]